MSQTVLRGFPGLPCEVRLEFQLPLPRNLACTLCRAVCPTIFRAGCCHAFCERCKGELMRSRPVLLCPVDGNETWTEKIVPDDTVWNSLKDFTVLCSQSIHGCRFSDTVAAFKNHIRDCPYMKKRCPLCEEDVLSKDLFSHLGSVCAKRPLACDHCGLNFHKELLNDHRENCPEKLVICEYCGADGLLLGEMPLHYEECDLKPWCCTMKDYGCAFEGPRKSLMEHLTFEDHIHIIVTHFKELSVVNKEQQEEIGHLNVQLDALTKAVKEGNRRVSTTLQTISRALHAQQEENRKLKVKLDDLSRMIEQKTIHPIATSKMDGTTTTHHRIPGDGTIERVTYPRFVEAGLVSRPVSARGTSSSSAAAAAGLPTVSMAAPSSTRLGRHHQST